MTTAFLTHDLIACGKRGVCELLHSREDKADAEAHFSNIGRLTVCNQLYTQRCPGPNQERQMISAPAARLGGIVRPNASAVDFLMTGLPRVALIMGKLCADSPLRILFVYSPTWR